MDGHIIRINKFKDYNPRVDVTASSWIRFQINFFEHPHFFDFTPEERIAWLYILCQAARTELHEFEISSPHFERITTASKKSLYRAIEKLKRRHIVTVRTIRGRYAGDTQTCTTNERTNVTNERTEGESQSADLDGRLPLLAEIWNANCGKLPKVTKSNAQRDRKAGILLKHNHPDEWVKIVQRIAASDFCTGGNDRGWTATFDWLLQPDVYLKVSEGKYDNRVTGQSKKSTLDLLKQIEAERSGNGN